MTELQRQIDAAKNEGVRTAGEVLQEIGRQYPYAAEIIEQDLANKDMSIEKCFAALYAHAKKNAKSGGWSCGGFTISQDNAAVKVILDFYKITLDASASADTQTFGHARGDNVIDLLDLL